MTDLTKADPKVPAVRIVSDRMGNFRRLELNGQPFEPWLSADHSITYERQESGISLLHLTLIVSGFTEEAED